nr:PREDICTED: glycoprotein hormone alpha-2 [Lepisosteus oculatus]
MSAARTQSPFLLPLLLLLLLTQLLLLPPATWSYEALGPGCHLYPFNVTIRSDRRGTCRGTHVVHACVGYCESSAFPSRYSVLLASNFTHNITSASQCCTISRDSRSVISFREVGSLRSDSFCPRPVLELLKFNRPPTTTACGSMDRPQNPAAGGAAR